MKISGSLLLVCLAAGELRNRLTRTAARFADHEHLPAQAQAQAEDQQTQLTFGVTDGAKLSNPDGSRQQPAANDDVSFVGASPSSRSLINSLSQSVKPLVFSSTSNKAAPSASDLYHLSVSLLTSLTSHAPPPPPTAFTPLRHSSSSTPLLDALEAKLGRTGGSAVRAARTVVNLVSGRSKARKGRDLSVTGVLGTLRNVVVDHSPLGKVAKKVKAGRKGAEGWRQKLETVSRSKGSSAALDESETEQAMEEVLRLARQAADSGSAEAWVLLGDLHLVSYSLAASPQNPADHLANA